MAFAFNEAPNTIQKSQSRRADQGDADRVYLRPQCHRGLPAGRNPSVLIRAMPTTQSNKTEKKPGVYSRNPSVLIRAMPTCP